MGQLIAFLKAIRYPNLVIIALTQYLIRYAILVPLSKFPVYAEIGCELQISDFDFFLLVLSSVLIAAGGNIINDYFDLKIDRINKPQKIIIGRQIKRRVAMATHWVLTAAGGAIALYMSWHVGLWKLALVQGFVIFSLWEYSLRLKHMPFVGNIVIGLLAALVPLLVGLYEIPLLNEAYKNELAGVITIDGSIVNFNTMAFWVLGFSAFAFVLTVSREIVKDIADVPGDMAYGSKTVPIVYGRSVAKFISIGLQLVAGIGALYVAYDLLPGDQRTVGYTWLFIITPLAFMTYKLMKAQSREDFLQVSNWNKAVSVFGVLYTLIAFAKFMEVVR